MASAAVPSARATPFPYTTLFRSLVGRRRPRGRRACSGARIGRHRVHGIARSEEHTSELQSREKLVCRLLLEKKNMEQPGTATGVAAMAPPLGGLGGSDA